MADKDRPMPKSLHTVTVLVKLVKHFSEVDDQPMEDALDRTMNLLGYDEKNDPHGLVKAAWLQLVRKGVE